MEDARRVVEAARRVCVSWRGRSAGAVDTQLAAMSSVSSSVVRTKRCIGPRRHDDPGKGQYEDILAHP
eukprot:scaffold87097_cov60-Phaeocystis_antarctica.AAC.2